MKKVTIYADGACSGNPGIGGWAAVLIYKDKKREISGGEIETTNNRMEMFAVIQALSALKEACDCEIYSDSQYVVDSINKGWVEKWKNNNWRNSGGEVKNIDLWQLLLSKIQVQHTVSFVKVKGHACVKMNERCDKLAKEAIVKLQNNDSKK